MEEKEQLTLKDAWQKTPGPKSIKESFVVFIKGVAMGTANIIPGVSGGTIALITGIFEPLLAAIASFNLDAVKSILRFDLKKALSFIHLSFLVPVFLGILTATAGTAGLMKYLLKEHRIETWSLFFGLIAASILVVKKEVDKWNALRVTLVIAGSIAAYIIVGLIPVQTPESYWFVFLCGMIAMCAMILPGLSGSFLLLILGKYEYIITAIQDPFKTEHALRLAVFVTGCIIGIAGFSRVLKWCLKKFHSETMCILIGFMIGAMRKIWPWKKVLDSKMIGGKEKILQEINVLPESFNSIVMLAIALAVVGFILVIVMEKISNKDKGKKTD
ncbi:MAG: DUF368 domain-containing protein [Planctomycetota bacterium]|jgi:putative membrane protein